MSTEGVKSILIICLIMSALGLVQFHKVAFPPIIFGGDSPPEKMTREFIDEVETNWDCSEHKCVRVSDEDFIYRGGYDTSPVVVESHKLVFFTIPKVSSSTWKKLFRRMMGYRDWKEGMAHVNESTNGLRYLHHYTKDRATEIMNSPEYTRAVFLRDPKDRLVSSYLDKTNPRIPTKDYMQNHCCHALPQGQQEDCIKSAKPSLAAFVNLTQALCPDDPHWQPQGDRIDCKFHSLLNFVGNMDTLQADAKRLLEKIGAWEKFGKSGWGPKGKTDQPIFTHRIHSTAPKEESLDEKWKRLGKYFTPELERTVETLYSSDYGVPQFNLKMRRVFKP